jgi:hypothetical protein
MSERDPRDSVPGAREPVLSRPRYRPMGEGGLLVEFANVIDPAVNARSVRSSPRSMPRRRRVCSI